MIFFVQTFEAAESVSEEEVVDTLLDAGTRWCKHYPGMYLVGVFSRKFRLGPRPDFIAIWSLREIATLDGWLANKGKFPRIAEIEERFGNAVRGVEARIMEGHGESLERVLSELTAQDGGREV